VDHVTARRLAIWLAARPQEPSFTRGLALFINTGVIHREFKNRLRIHARSAAYFDQAVERRPGFLWFGLFAALTVPMRNLGEAA
jgi:hypothetical protein